MRSMRRSKLLYGAVLRVPLFGGSSPFCSSKLALKSVLLTISFKTSLYSVIPGLKIHLEWTALSGSLAKIPASDV